MTQKPFILLTNDDGIDAPGLRALCSAVATVARVEVVAPDGQRSAAGHSISVLKDMKYRTVDVNGAQSGHALSGTPADCVKLAVAHLFKDKPDIIISGINPGANIGNSIHYSGTVAAAREGAMYGIPSIALSVGYIRRNPVIYFETAAQFALQLIEMVLKNGLPPRTILNVNVPNLPFEQINGVVITRQGNCVYVDEMESLHENGMVHTFRNVGAKSIPSEEGEDYDDLVLAEGKISITPMHYDLTHHEFLDDLRKWIDTSSHE